MMMETIIMSVKTIIGSNSSADPVPGPPHCWGDYEMMMKIIPCDDGMMMETIIMSVKTIIGSNSSADPVPGPPHCWGDFDDDDSV